MKSTAAAVVALGAFVNVALAGNAFIPTGISSGCSSFLSTLDADSSLSSCTAPLIKATSPFAPGSNSANSTSKDVSSALATLCGSGSTACDAGKIREHLTGFYSACSADITSNKDVARTYDVLYTLVPLTQAVCAKDDSNKFCVQQTAASASSASNGTAHVNLAVTGKVESIAEYLYTTVKRSLRRRGAGSDNNTTSSSASAQQPLLIPNTTTFRSSNLAFLYLTPQSPKSQLCSTCTKAIMNTYTSFELTVPYASGLGSSPLLGGQNELYQAINGACGSDFLGNNGVAQAAGGLQGAGAGVGAASAGVSVAKAFVGAAALVGAVVALL